MGTQTRIGDSIGAIWGQIWDYFISAGKCRNSNPESDLLYLLLFSDNYFRCLTASFASYLPRVLPPIALKYEEHVNRAFEAPPPDVLSTFAR